MSVAGAVSLAHSWIAKVHHIGGVSQLAEGLCRQCLPGDYYRIATSSLRSRAASTDTGSPRSRTDCVPATEVPAGIKLANDLPPSRAGRFQAATSGTLRYRLDPRTWRIRAPANRVGNRTTADRR